MEARAMGKDPASTEEKDKIEATAKGGSLMFFVYPKEEYEVSKVYTNKYYVTIRLYSQTSFEIPGCRHSDVSGASHDMRANDTTAFM